MRKISTSRERVVGWIAKPAELPFPHFAPGTEIHDHCSFVATSGCGVQPVCSLLASNVGCGFVPASGRSPEGIAEDAQAARKLKPSARMPAALAPRTRRACYGSFL